MSSQREDAGQSKTLPVDSKNRKPKGSKEHMAQKVLVITSGTEAAGVGITYLHQVKAHPSSQLHTMVCSIDTDNLSVHYVGFREDEWLPLSIPARHISMVRRDPNSDPTLKEILYPGIMPEIAGSGGGSIRYNTAGAIIINRDRVKGWLKGHMTNLIASDDGQNNLAIVIVVSAVGATGSGTLERLMDMVISVAQDVRIPEPIPLDVFILQPGTTNVSTLNLANTVALYLEGAASRLSSRTDDDEDDLHSRPYRGRTIMVDWGSTVTLEALSQLRETAATLVRVTHDPASAIAAEFQRTEIDHHVLRALDVRTNLPSYLSSATPVTISLGNLEEQIIQRDAVRLVNYLVLGEQTIAQSTDVLLAEQDPSNLSSGPLLDSLTHFLQGGNSDERYEHLLDVLTQDIALISMQTTAARLDKRTAQQQAQKLRADWQSDKEHIPALVEDIRQKGSDLVRQTFQLIDTARRKGIATTLSLRELRAQYRAMRQIIVEALNSQPYNMRIGEQQVNDELDRLARTRFGQPRPQATISAVQTNLRGMVQRASHAIAQAVLRAILTHCDEALRDLGLVLAKLSRQLQSDVNWQMAQQPLTIETHHPLELPALAEKEINGYAEQVSIFSAANKQSGQSKFDNFLQSSDQEKIDPLAAFRKWLEDEGKLPLLFAGNIKELYDLAFNYAEKYVHNEVLEHSVLTILQRAGDGVLEQRVRDAVARAQILVPIDRTFAPELEEKLLISAHWEDTVQEADLHRAVRESVKRSYKLLTSEDPGEIIILYYADGLPMSATNDLTSRCLEQFLSYRARWYKQQRQQNAGASGAKNTVARRSQRAGVPVYSGLDAENRVAQTGVLYELYRVRRQNIGKYTVQDIPELGDPAQADSPNYGSTNTPGSGESSNGSDGGFVPGSGSSNGTTPNAEQPQNKLNL
jgi:hypothetical protein